MSAHGSVLHREPCPACGSKDNVTVYEDGYKKCFGASCDYYIMPLSADVGREDGDAVVAARREPVARGYNPVSHLDVVALRSRHISEKTCDKFHYQVGKYKGKVCQLANYYRKGQWVCAKLRFPPKEDGSKGFMMIGDGANAPLYGQWLWRDKGKMLVITEGEIDALTVSQLQGNKWPVVSIPNGAQSAVATVKRELEWVEGFDRVVLMFDMDEAGQMAARDVAELLTPGKACIAHLGLKDANEMHQAGRGKEVIDAIWSAKVYRPDGIVNGADLWDEATRDLPGGGIAYPWPKLNAMLRGMRPGELVTITAGAGIGKSTMCKEIAYELAVKHEQNVGCIFLEENTRKTTQSFMGMYMNQRIDIDARNWSDLADDERQARRAAFDSTLGTERLFLYDHFGSTDVDNLLSRVRYLARGCDCRWIVLDHLSIVVSAMQDEKLDERKLIDRAMTLLRTLVEETGIGLILVSHLKRPGEGRGYDEGREVRLSGLRGSASIEQLSDVVIGLERNMQAEDSHLMRARVLKNRPIGETGPCDHITYDSETGRYVLAEDDVPWGDTEEDF